MYKNMMLINRMISIHIIHVYKGGRRWKLALVNRVNLTVILISWIWDEKKKSTQNN